MGLAMAAEGSGLIGTDADLHGMRDASYELYQMSAEANYGAEFHVMHQIVEQAYQANLQNAHAVTNQIALDATREGIRIAAYISPVAAVIDTGIEAANGNKSGDEIAVELATLGVGRKIRAADSVPEFITVFRGDRAGTTIIKSSAARESGYDGSQRIIDSNNLDDLFRGHALDSSSPPSPFISVRTDPAVARYFAGPNDVVNEFRIPVSRATPNPFNNYVVPAGPGRRLTPEAEYLVPNYIRPSEFVRKP